VMASAIKDGMEAIMIPRNWIRLNGLSGELLLEEPPPMEGRNLIFQCLAKLLINEIARVRFVVPVVPDDEITFAPIELAVAIDVPPVPTIGSFFFAAASNAFLLLPSGSALMNTIPSMKPFSISSATLRSTPYAC